MIQIKEKRDCCGCSACVQRCPKHCISLEEDKEGFLYPKVDENKCINCGLCERVCHELHPYEEKFPMEVYAAINVDEKIRLKSSSGGIFYLMAKYTINEGGIVFGAKFDSNWQVVFDYSETLEGCKKFMGSKYVQARVDTAFKNAEHFLKSGRKVLFSGAPCQIAALHHFLRKEYSNLYTVDFVCHGVPSPKVWRLYLKEVLIKYNDIHNIEFRNKRKGWKNFYFVVENKDSSQSLYVSHFEDSYMRAFLENMSIRPSCYNCKAKQGRSNSDITIADFWGIRNEYSQMDDDKGTSLILINTPKGRETFDWSKIKKIKTSFDVALKYNLGLNATAKPHKKRELFFSNIDDEKSIIKLIDICLKLPFKKRLWNFLSMCKMSLLCIFTNSKSGGARCYKNNNVLKPLPNTYISNITFRKKIYGWKNYGLEITLSTKQTKIEEYLHMKILIDGRSITPQISGISRYTYELIKGYVEEYGKEKVTVILNDEIENFPYKKILCPYQRHEIIDNIKFSKWLSRQDYDIYHSGDLTGPFWHKKGVKHIITCHDLMFVVLKGYYGKETFIQRIKDIKNKLFFKFIVNDADEIISVSNTTCTDLKKIYNRDSIVLPEGVNEIKHVQEIHSYNGLSKDSFFLYVGLGAPHKNIDFLVKAFLDSNTDKKLVLCGKGHKKVNSDRIIYPGWISDDVLDFLYRNCAAFIFPSKYEGFGLPILEALSYNCRVFSSNAGSLSEFSDKYVHFFNPYKENELKQLIENCDSIEIDGNGIDTYLKGYRWKNIWKEYHQKNKK